MDELFGSNNANDLFQEKKKSKKDVKKIFKTILVILLILILLSGSAYAVFYYLTEIKNRDARTDIIEIAKNIDFNKYTDINGLSGYFNNINNSSYEFNADLEVNSNNLNNQIKDILKNEDVNIKDFKLNFNGKIDRNNNKLQTFVDLKHKDNSVFDFQIQDTGEQILLHGKDIFQEFIGLEKSKLKSFMIKEFNLDNENATRVDDFTKISLNTNNIGEINAILDSIIKSFPEALETLTDENFELNRNIKINYRNNSLNAQKYTLKLNAQQFENFIIQLSNLSKIKANDASIEIQSLVGKTDNIIDSTIQYLKQIIYLKDDEVLNIDMYIIKNNLAKIEFVKVKEDVEIERKVVFEIELINEKKSNEILISNEEVKLKIRVTKDNSRIYTEIDIDGKIPLPVDNVLNQDDNSIKEINDTKNNTEQVTNEGNLEEGRNNNFASDAIITDPVVPDDSHILDPSVNNNTEINNENTNNIPVVDVENNNETQEEVPKVDFVEDKDSILLNETLFTKKIEIKAKLNFDRPINNSSSMNFNLVYNSNEIEILAKADISIKENIQIDNSGKVVLITDMEGTKLKANMKAITDKVYLVFFNKLKSLNLMKE